jgi:uncharacterized protein YdaU (DUF1376 family)
MHYYQFNIGDYASHTRHLSPLEDIAYRRCLDAYYLHERPLNTDAAVVARLIGMREHEHEVQTVLQEFFEASPDGWFNERANREIEHFRLKSEQASRAGKASAERRLNGRSTERLTDVQPNINQEPITNNQSILPSVSVEAEAINVPKRPSCPQEELLKIYHDRCPSLQRVMMLNETRKRHIASRWREVMVTDNLTRANDGLEIFGQFFERVEASNFLAGRTQNRNGRPWKATFDWLIQPTNFLKVCEGHYDNGRN